jgi:hypothetical protein
MPPGLRYAAPIFLILGLIVMVIGITRPAFLWELTRLRGIRSALGESGASVMLIGIGLANIVFAIVVFLKGRG